MGKHRQFQGSALPYIFRIDENSCISQFLGMCIFPLHENILWKAISLPGCGFLKKIGNFFLVHGKYMEFIQLWIRMWIHTIPKTWGKGIPIRKKKFGKKQTFQNYGFLNTWCEAEIHTNPTPRDEWIPILGNKYGKTQTISRFCSTSQI